MRSIILSLAALLVLAPATLACGDDRTERGLAPANETAAPMDPAEMEETGAERQQEIEDKYEAIEDKAFDESKGVEGEAKALYPEED